MPMISAGISSWPLGWTRGRARKLSSRHVALRLVLPRTEWSSGTTGGPAARHSRLIWKEAQMSLTTETATDRDVLGEQTREQLRIALSCDSGERDRIHEQVVHNHLWLADSLARRFRRPSEDIEDLQQVARTGLVQAVRRYDPEHGPFTAFAVPT